LPANSGKQYDPEFDHFERAVTPKKMDLPLSVIKDHPFQVEGNRINDLKDLYNEIFHS